MKINNFNSVIEEVDSIKMKEPLAETLGALNQSQILEYSFKDIVKFAGHSCPTVSGAYICCKNALEKLYEKDIPIEAKSQ